MKLTSITNKNNEIDLVFKLTFEKNEEIFYYCSISCNHM
jgi:hypothetical protein